MGDFRYTRPDALPPVTKGLIIANIVVFAAEFLFPKMAGIDIESLFALYPIGKGFQAYQIITHLFTHSLANIFHIILNMFLLWMVGRLLENVWGSQRFLLFYTLCGIGAAVLHLFIEYLTGGYASAIGASGAIMGLFIAFAYLFPNTELYMYFIPIPIKAKWVAIVYVLYDLYGGVRNTDNIAHFAHLGGALTGFILVLIWNRSNRTRFY